MRRLSLFVVLFCLGFCSLRAQVGEYRSDLAVGFNGGCVLNKLNFSPTVKQDYHTGVTGGLTLRYTSELYYNILCSFQAEVNYAQMGWKERIETSDDTYERTMNYVQLPLLARLAYGKEQRGVCGYLVLGPQLGYLVSDREQRSGTWSQATLSLRPNGVIGQYGRAIQNKFEYGLLGGLGMEVNTRIGHFLLEGRYFYALSDVFHNGKADYFARSANGAIIAKLSYLIDIKKTKK